MKYVLLRRFPFTAGQVTESSSELAESVLELRYKRLGANLGKGVWGKTMAIAVGMLRFYCCGPGAVHIFDKMRVFLQPGPLSLNGSFPFSQLEMCAVLERGALGSLKRVKNGHQERFV